MKSLITAIFSCVMTGTRKRKYAKQSPCTKSTMSRTVTKETINMTQPSACTYFSKKPKNKKQMQLFVPTQDGVAKMDVMVADFVQHNTLPLSLTYCTLFTGMIKPKN